MDAEFWGTPALSECHSELISPDIIAPIDTAASMRIFSASCIAAIQWLELQACQTSCEHNLNRGPVLVIARNLISIQHPKIWQIGQTCKSITRQCLKLAVSLKSTYLITKAPASAGIIAANIENSNEAYKPHLKHWPWSKPNQFGCCAGAMRTLQAPSAQYAIKDPELFQVSSQ